MDRSEFESWLSTEEGRKVAQPYFDQRVQNGIETFKANHPDPFNLYAAFEPFIQAQSEEAIKKAREGLFTEEQVQERVNAAVEKYKKDSGADVTLRRLEKLEQADKLKAEQVRKIELDKYLFCKAKEAGVDYSLLSDFPFQDEAAIDAKVDKLRMLNHEHETALRNILLATGGHKPGSGAARSEPRRVENMSQGEVNTFEAYGQLDGEIRRQFGDGSGF